MAYADFNFYYNNYFGDVLSSTEANRWLERASDELDRLTFGRLTNNFPTDQNGVIKVKKAVCAVAEALYLVDAQRKSVTATKDEDGQYKGAITSIKSGSESITFAAGGASSSIYAAAAASSSDEQTLVSSIAAKYLANVEDCNGINLLYAGEVRYYVQQNDNTI